MPPTPRQVAEAKSVESELVGRSVEEWQGKTPDAAIPKRVKLRVLLRYGGKCYRTGHKFRPGDRIEFDHIIALANGGQHRESNLAPILGGKPHQEKTAEDVKVKAKIARTRAAHLGLKPKSNAFRKPPGARFDWSRGRYVREGET